MRTQIIASFIVAAIILTSCHCEKSLENYTFADSSFQKMMPYSGIDTLYFLHNNNHSDTFLGQGMVKIDDDVRPANYPGCGKEIYTEKVSCIYKNLNHSGMDITFSMYYRYYQDATTPDQYFSIQYNNAIRDGLQSGILSKMKYDLDSITVNGNIYACMLLSSDLYYSTKYGIIKWILFNSSLQRID